MARKAGLCFALCCQEELQRLVGEGLREADCQEGMQEKLGELSQDYSICSGT